MKKIVALLLGLVMILGLVAACTPAAVQEAAQQVAEAAEQVAEEVAPTEEAPVEEAAPAAEKKVIGFYADNVDSYYKAVSDTLIALAGQDAECDWDVTVVTGTGAASEQLDAVQNFITAGVDAVVVIQNNPSTTSECIAMCEDAGIAYFGACHDFSGIENKFDAEGSCCYDFVKAGYYAGQDALARGKSKIVNVEGVLGQGSAAAQSLGFIQAYEDAGVNLNGWTAQKMAEDKPNADTGDLTIVLWASGGWQADSAKKIMTDAIASLGADGFDGVYAQNDPMMEGVIQALEEAGLNPSDYWLGASNGREISWQWCKDGVITMDVNQAATLEGDVIYQQLKAFFAGAEYRKYIHPYLTPYSIDDVNDKALLPFSDTEKYVADRNAGAFNSDLNNTDLIVDNPGYAG